MTFDSFVGRIDGVRRTSRGYKGRCPAHPDRSPSLSISEGTHGILVRCFAGCTVKDICDALNLKEADLFYDAPRNPRQRALLPPRPRPFDWRRASSELLHGAEVLELRAGRVLAVACRLDPSTWSDGEVERALAAVARAYRNRERAELFRDATFDLRVRGLASNQQRVGVAV